MTQQPCRWREAAQDASVPARQIARQDPRSDDHYFLPAIEEVLTLPPEPGYVEYLASGGVVNLVSDETATAPVEGVHGALTAQGASAHENAAVSGNLSGGNGRFAYRVNGSAQRSGDYSTPEGDPPNSLSNSKSGGASLALTGEHGFVGASYIKDLAPEMGRSLRLVYGLRF